MGANTSLEARWSELPATLRARGQRWTPQRALVIRHLSDVAGHVTGAELVEMCRRDDPSMVPSTVYRTLAALEELGYLRHSHGADGREEFEVAEAEEHGHLYCTSCGTSIELSADELQGVASALRPGGFEPDPSHLTIVGLCRDCRTH